MHVRRQVSVFGLVGVVRFGFGCFRFGLVWFVLVWFGLGCFGFGVVLVVLVWVGLVWFGLVWLVVLFLLRFASPLPLLLLCLPLCLPASWLASLRLVSAVAASLLAALPSRCLVWFGLVWFGFGFGLVWFWGLVWFGLVWFGLRRRFAGACNVASLLKFSRRACRMGPGFPGPDGALRGGGFQCLVHNQRHGFGLQSLGQELRRRVRLNDDNSLLHRRPDGPGWQAS